MTRRGVRRTPRTWAGGSVELLQLAVLPSFERAVRAKSRDLLHATKETADAQAEAESERTCRELLCATVGLDRGTRSKC